MDGTFKLVSQPFTQLYTIHGFISHGQTKKQVPMAFIFMSGRRKVHTHNTYTIFTIY